MGLNSFAKALVIVVLVSISGGAHGWGLDGHFTICRLAQPRLSKAAADAVSELLPAAAEKDLASVCIWADKIKFRYGWSRPLHYINTPDNECTYDYKRDCKDEHGGADRCVAGAIKNYTSQLLTYGTKQAQQYNLTEALLFVSHFLGDVHQPLHVGFTTDKGANTIGIRWYRTKQNLHHVWDTNIIETEEENYHNSNVEDLIRAIDQNITKVWSKDVKEWEACDHTACPDIYASEGIKAACDWAYKGVEENSTLADEYFESRWPVVNLRLAQAGVRLAATLNRIFKG
ncbi:endonuclease 2-like [Andrographis paniculata]|uniref:endonuclease 2-like n=1 Tax=Andrographis paniculata TaxID=175694 RepID=UPI0021E93402|nr:endonuclease 2-like [Andrographis paniculata]